jgi:hypothetical protein
MNVTLQEVGLTGGSGIYGVGEPTRTSTQYWTTRAEPAAGPHTKPALTGPNDRLRRCGRPSTWRLPVACRRELDRGQELAVVAILRDGRSALPLGRWWRQALAGVLCF